MFIARNLRRFRLHLGLTQEELATRLGVTGQAVGKWERDECYPDITLLPGIANLFDITVDELIGMEEHANQKKLNDIYKKAQELGSLGKYHELISLLEAKIKLFPNELLTDLAIALTLTGDKTERPIRLFEQALQVSSSKSYKARGTLYAELCFLYSIFDQTEKSEKLARSLPHARESRELILPYFLNKAQRADYLRENLPGILMTISSLIDENLSSNFKQIHSIHFGINIDEISFDDALKKIAEFLRK